MEWTKIPTDLIASGASDLDILAIVKYQLVWALLERKPDNKNLSRYLTPKQIQRANAVITAIERQVISDITTVNKKRNRQKIYYEKNQLLKEKTDGHTDVHTDSHTDPADKIRLDKNPPIVPQKGDKKFSEEFESFWKEFPKQRIGSKDKAYTSFCRVLKEKRATLELLLKSVKQYALSDEVKKGFAKGCAAWLNDDRFNVQYQHENKYGNWDNF